MHTRGERRHTGFAWLALSTAALLLVACGSTPVGPQSSSTTDQAAAAATTAGAATATAERDFPRLLGASGTVAGRNQRLLIYLPVAGDNLRSIATRFLDRADLAWQIEQANGLGGPQWGRPRIEPGVPLIVPLQPGSPIGVDAGGVQTVPILCYHRFGSGNSKMTVSPDHFEAQLDWLARNDWRVLRLADLAPFLAGKQALPPRSVVITIDDGYESVYRYAWPALKRHGFHATLFIYSDFIGARDGLSWAQLQEMAKSGVVDIQAHSRSHRNLVQRRAGESEATYRRNVQTEVAQPRALLDRKLASAGVNIREFAYPYGDANDLVLDALQAQDYSMGLTVTPGGNPFYADPLMLRRTMIFGDHDLEDFKERLVTRRALAAP
ncbi:MAG: polysaccharide deacetylase family protein [Pseudomonadota bacterium]|nr:polysaccharide deacetylase family protein [Pseudomonadota bacterium]